MQVQRKPFYTLLHRRLIKRLTLLSFFFSLLLVLLAHWSVQNVFLELPSTHTLHDYTPPAATEVYAKNNEKIGEFFEEKRYFIPFEA